MSCIHALCFFPQSGLIFSELSKFVMQPSDLTLLSGDTAMFVCKAKAKPLALHSWTRNDVPLSPPTGRVLLHQRGEVLEIRQVTSADAGQYRCLAENTAGELTSAYASLSVDNGVTTGGCQLLIELLLTLSYGCMCFSSAQMLML